MNGAQQVDLRNSRCSRRQTTRAPAPAMCTSAPVAWGGLTPTADYGSRCLHTRCVRWRSRSWCTIRNNDHSSGRPHPHSSTAWGWCTPCSRLGRLRCRYRRGQMVSGNWENRGSWYSATIGGVTRGRRACTYTLNYLDGDVERRVIPRRIKKRTCKQFNVCDRIEANYGGRGRWYAGRIRRRSGTCARARYSIGYDDGDSETNVVVARVRILRINPIKPYKRRQQVMANYQGRGRWFPGRISRVVSACCYAVAYNDGDSERCVDPVMLRRIPKGRCEDKNRRRCVTGFRVQANWNGYGRYYNAVVTGCTRGAFSLRYSDGDTESMVPGSRLRNCRAPPRCNTRTLIYRRGSNVFANFRNAGRWFPGRVRSVDTRRCTYSIYYSDGDREASVAPSRVCKRPWRWALRRTVTANWRGLGRYYRARITRRNADGTYYLTYADGDREAKVSCNRIRA